MALQTVKVLTGTSDWCIVAIHRRNEMYPELLSRLHKKKSQLKKEVLSMAFGQTMEEKPIRSGQATNEDGTPIVYSWQWIPLAGTNSRDNGKVKGGVRKIRLLPALDTAGQIIV